MEAPAREMNTALLSNIIIANMSQVLGSRFLASRVTFVHRKGEYEDLLKQ